MIIVFIAFGWMVVVVSFGIFKIKPGGDDDWFFLYAFFVMVAFSTAAFVHRRRVLEPMLLGSLGGLGKLEPTIARMIEILVYGFFSYFVLILCLRHVIWVMPQWLLDPSMWSTLAIFTGTAFFCWSYSQNLRGYRRDIALSAATGPLVVLAFEAVDYVGTRYKQDWIYAGGFYLLIPIILAFLAARIFDDKPLQRYIDADVDERLALWRLHTLALIFQPSWWEMCLYGMKRAVRLRRLS